jgi:uncharacterized protein YjbI with pentapeptide repeats
MKVIKPQKLGVLTRAFEDGPQAYLTTTVLALFAFEPRALLPEVALWKLAADELGKQAILDECLPKPRGEVLLRANAYPAGGAARIACSPRVRLGAIDKSLTVVGDRVWKRGGVASDPEPFTAMPITWERAFGGAGFAQNPLGRGFAALRAERGDVHPLPNVEDPKRLVASPGDRPLPAGFGPYDLTWPQRFAKVGTYDEAWLRERFPGIAKDLDPTFFNAAPDDQQIEGYFRGDEPFALENLHPTRPLLEGALPSIAARVFLTRRHEGAEGLREVPMRLDTVWLFPHKERGIVVFRGLTKVVEDDAADVLHLVAACEDLGAEPRPLAHYEAVLARRLDRTKGHLSGLRDDELLPAPRGAAAPLPEEASDVAALVEIEGLQRQNLRRRAELEREQTRAVIVEHGLDPDVHGPPPLPPDPPAPTLDTLEVLVDQTTAMADQHKASLEQQRAAAVAEQRRVCEEHGLDYDKLYESGKEGVGEPPSFRARDEMDKLHALSASLAASGQPSPGLDALITDPAVWRRLVLAEQKLLETYRASAHLLPPARRLDADAAARLRDELARAHAAGESFAGRDLTGADLAGMSLARASLEGALLERADLTGADLTGADLTGAVLTRATLARVKLAGARLAGANLGGADLTEADLSGGVDLTDAVLHEARLERACLRQAVLKEADLSEAVFTGADLAEAEAREALFYRCDLAGMSFAGADLRKASFLEARLEGADFAGATLEGAVLLAVKGDRASFRGARLDNVRLVKECSFQDADFSGVQAERANLRGADLTRARLRDAVLDGSDLSEARLVEADLYRVSAREARLARADLTRASMIGANLMLAIVQKATIDGVDWTGANLFRADLWRVRGKAASVKDALLVEARIAQREDR